MSVLSIPDCAVKLPSNGYYYNSRFSAKDDQITEIVGKDPIITNFQKVFQYNELDNDSSESVVFQVCLTAQSTQVEPKPDARFINVKKWTIRGKQYIGSGLTWHTVHASTQILLKLIENGFTIRFGIKHDGNDLKNYVGTQAIALDLDVDESINWERNLDIALDNYISPFIIHYTPSGNPQNNKMRMIILFKEFVTDYDLATELIKGVNELFPSAAKHVHDPARFFYTTIASVPHFDLQAFNSFSELHERHKFIAPITEGVTDKKDGSQWNHNESDTDRNTANKQFVDYLHEHVIKDDSTMFELAVDWCRHHGFSLQNWANHPSPGTGLEQWRGLDPIDPEHSRTGNSFTISYMPDNTYVYKSDRTGVTGDMVDLWFRLSVGDWKVNGGMRSHSAWWQAVREICEHHELPDFTIQYERNKLKQLGLNGDLTGCLNQEKLEKGSIVLVAEKCFDLFLSYHENMFYYQSTGDFYWIYSKDLCLWKKIHTKTELNSYVREFLESFGTLYGHPIRTFLTVALIRGLQACVAFLPKGFIIEEFEPEYDYVPCANGAYSIKDCQLVEYHASIRNTVKSKFNYRQSTGDGLKAFTDFLDYIVVDKRCIPDILKWLAVTVQYKGFYTRKALAIVGDSGTGKSGLTNMIRSLVMTYEVKPTRTIVKDLKTTTLLAENARFATMQLEGIILGVLTEFTGLPSNSDGSLLKDLIANPTDDSRGILIAGEHKGGSHVDIWVRAAIMSNGQDFPKLPFNDDGWDRRLMIMKVRRNQVTNNEIFEAPLTHLEDFFCWCLEQDSDEIVKYFVELSRIKDSDFWMNKVLLEMKASNNKYWRFAEEKLESMETNQIKVSDLFRVYREWCNDAEERPQTDTLFKKNMVLVLVGMFQKSPSSVLIKGSDSRWYFQGVAVKVD